MENKATAMILISALSAVVSYGAVIADFEGHTVGDHVMDNEPKYDYTSDTTYNPATAAANSLVFRAGTGTDYIIQDRGTGHEKSLHLNGSLNTGQTDQGIYILQVDMTAGGANASQVTRVSYSFDILGTSDDADMGLTDWTVKINYASGSGNITHGDAWFNGVGSVTNQTFDINNAGKTGTTGWKTISGFYDIAVGEAGTAGGIQISTDVGAFVSGGTGGYTVDNITLNVSAIPEPATLGLLGLFGTGVLFIRRLFLI
jgi:hypothetical protein